MLRGKDKERQICHLWRVIRCGVWYVVKYLTVGADQSERKNGLQVFDFPERHCNT